MVGDGQQVCRTDARPRGWIAVAYVAADGACSKGARGKAEPMIAVLTRHADLPVHSTLDVCADEQIPTGWVRERTPSTETNDSCPGAERDGSTTLRIRRVS